MLVNHRQTFKNLLLAATLFASPLVLAFPHPAAAQLSIGVSVQLEPPVLPVYVQPPIPEVGYIWTPGYWAWGGEGEAGYYWVPGTWVMPPTVGLLWTPPYWGWSDGAYIFHDGYWGDHVGFYGGVNYGFGYGGHGFEGGRWENGGFIYNRSVNNFGSVHIANSYDRKVTVSNDSHVSFAGGAGGIKAEPTAEERAVEHEHHVAATADQSRHMTAAAKNPELAASHNNGHPTITATSRPAQFTKPADRPAATNGPAQRPNARPEAAPERVAPERAAPERAAPERAAPERPTAVKPAPEKAPQPAPPQAEHAAPHPAPAHEEGKEKEEKKEGH